MGVTSEFCPATMRERDLVWLCFWPHKCSRTCIRLISSFISALDVPQHQTFPFAQTGQETMPTDSPVEIPEITQLICSYLDNNDLVTCVRVSKGWHGRFLPFLWCAITLDTYTHGKNPPPPFVISQHRHLIYELTLHGSSRNHFLGYESFHYPNLRKLRISIEGRPLLQDISLDFANMFPSLVNLSLRRVNVTAATWSTLSAHRHCRILELDQCELRVEGLSEFWRACTNLESLELFSVTIPERSVPAGVEFSRMSRLSIAYIQRWDGVSELDLFIRCPRLKHMAWETSFRGTDPIHGQVSKFVKSDQWPHLDTLLIPHLQDTDLGSIIQRAGCLSGIILSGFALVGGQSIKQIGYHFSTLTKVDLRWAISVPSSTILDIMCGCPRLEILTARDVYARDIAQGRPWTCLELRELEMCIAFGESEQDLHRVVFERLSALVRLVSLRLSYSVKPSDCPGRIQLRLDLGMGQLASLQQLRDVQFLHDYGSREHSHPQVGKEEAEWIVENWKNLKMIKGNFNSDKEEDRRSKAVLARHRIDVTYDSGALSSSD
ncbi:hypothetical protein B0O80DRAFT_435171 [Mortierella sp. GBAus27b]|nr:hypothetical protein B0O80DRAFT_435171 [Mortierella sp. GBAus27b]